MTLEETLAKIKEFEHLNDPREIDQILFEVSAHKTDLEEELHGIDYQVTARKLELIKQLGKVNQAEMQVEIEPIGQKQKELERAIKALGEFKANLRRRFDLLTNQHNPFR